MTDQILIFDTTLRDGEQSPGCSMNLEEKLEMFQLLVQVGFKEIEVGFPSASQIEYDFLRLLIDGRHIPDGVVPQVLTQAPGLAEGLMTGSGDLETVSFEALMS